MRIVSQPSTQPCEDAALLWVSRLTAYPGNQRLDPQVLPTAEKHEFDQWLQTPANARAFEDARSLWMLMGKPGASLAREEAAALDGYLNRRTPRKRRPRFKLAAAAIAATVLIATALGITARPEQWFDNAIADYRTQPGQLQSLVLGDGSEVVLDGDSAISVSLRAGHRDIRLLRGAAYFHVSHNGEPFVVHTGDGEVRVLGTRFEVRLAADNTVVTVEQGRVGVDGDGGSEQQLTADQRVGFGSSGNGAVQSINAQQALGWREHRVSFRQQSLKDALQVVQRYYPQRILVLNPQLADQPVSGDFGVEDPKAIVTALQSLLGFSLQQLPGGSVVIW